MGAMRRAKKYETTSVPNPNQLGLEFGARSVSAVAEDIDDSAELDDCTWSAAVALDPRHRPQQLERPSSTVRRCWCFSPQEAHLLDETRRRYRRLSVAEIATVQGFDPAWFSGVALRTTDKVRAIGDAVPPPLAKAVVAALTKRVNWTTRTAVEICAGAGGLASASVDAGFEHQLLIDYWAPACAVLRSGKPWAPERVVCGSVSDYDFRPLKGKVGLLSGGPPCQPWSHAGRRDGHDDPRDLLGRIHEIVNAIEPDAFVFENVPGLFTDENQEYLSAVLARLRAPCEHLRYGVVSGILNAADFGVPQLRRRVFIIGVRDQPSSCAYRILDDVAAHASHRDPTKAAAGRRPWVTLREAFANLPDPGGWKHWPF